MRNSKLQTVKLQGKVLLVFENKKDSGYSGVDTDPTTATITLTGTGITLASHKKQSS